jgi:hypothetical protein
LNAARAHHEEVPHIAFLNLAFHAGGPYLILSDQRVEQAVIALWSITRRMALHAPFVLHADVNVLELPIRREISRLCWDQALFIAQDVEHLLLHRDDSMRFRETLAGLLQHGVPARQVTPIE